MTTGTHDDSREAAADAGPATSARGEEIRRLFEHSARRDRRQRNWGVSFAVLCILGVLVLAGAATVYARRVDALQAKEQQLRSQEKKLKASIDQKQSALKTLDGQLDDYKQYAVSQKWEVARLQKTNHELTTTAPLATVVTPHARFKRLVGRRGPQGQQLYEFRLWLEVPKRRRGEVTAASYKFENPHYIKRRERSTNAEDGFCVHRIVWECLPRVEVTLHLESGIRRRTFDMCDLSGWKRGYVRIGSGTNRDSLVRWSRDLEKLGFEPRVMSAAVDDPFQVVLGPFPSDKVEVARTGWLRTGEDRQALISSGKPFTDQVYPPPPACSAPRSSEPGGSTKTPANVAPEQKPKPPHKPRRKKSKSSRQPSGGGLGGGVDTEPIQKKSKSPSDPLKKGLLDDLEAPY